MPLFFLLNKLLYNFPWKFKAPILYFLFACEVDSICKCNVAMRQTTIDLPLKKTSLWYLREKQLLHAAIFTYLKSSTFFPLLFLGFRRSCVLFFVKEGPISAKTSVPFSALRNVKRKYVWWNWNFRAHTLQGC